MTKQWAFIQPNDVWMFRDSKPFSAQQNFVARSQFPPNPMTMQGVIRSHFLETNGVDYRAFADGNERPEIHDIAGTPENFGSLEISGPFVGRWTNQGVERLYPVPQDLLWNKDAKAFYQLVPTAEYAGAVNAPVDGWRPLMSPGDLADYKEAPGWLTQAQMDAYLRGQLTEGSPITEIYDIEERVGLKLNYGKRAAQESYLYHAQFIRPEDNVGLLVGVNIDLFDESGVIGIGGEARSGHYQRVAYDAGSAVNNGRVRVVIQTPAYFSEGWQPANGDWSPFVGGGRLVSAAIGKTIAISGWNVARNKPKPLRHYVPAGSVYYFEDAELSGVPFTETPASEPGLNYPAMGFGAFVAGNW